jgi:hypothetical protein
VKHLKTAWTTGPLQVGPVGIWVWMSKNAVIQYCHSHHNYAGLTKDGGGFDIDGGASNCMLQYNYSYNNEGAGYLLAEYGTVFPFTNNIVRFNISINDGRKNGYGSISIWGAHQDHSVTNTYIYNNTIFLDDKKLISGTPAGITLFGPHFKNVIIANNIIATRGNVNIINADTIVNRPAFMLLHNVYYSYTNQYTFQSGKNRIASFQSWFKLNPEQEKWNGRPSLINNDPMFKTYENLTVLTAPDAGDHFRTEGLVLSPESPLRKNLFPIADYFKILSTTRDYCNVDIPLKGLSIPEACNR